MKRNPDGEYTRYAVVMHSSGTGYVVRTAYFKVGRPGYWFPQPYTGATAYNNKFYVHESGAQRLADKLNLRQQNPITIEVPEELIKAVRPVRVKAKTAKKRAAPKRKRATKQQKAVSGLTNALANLELSTEHGNLPPQPGVVKRVLDQAKFLWRTRPLSIPEPRRGNPLKHGYSRKTVSANISREIKHGKKPQSAVAMSLREARKAWREKHPRGPFPEHLRKNPGGTMQVIAGPHTKRRHAANPMSDPTKGGFWLYLRTGRGWTKLGERPSYKLAKRAAEQIANRTGMQVRIDLAHGRRGK